MQGERSVSEMRQDAHLDCWHDESLIAVEGFNQLHVVFCKRKVEHLQVLLDSRGCHALRDAHNASLDVPPADAKKLLYIITEYA